MKTTKTFALTALALIVGLSSCTKSDNSDNPNDQKLKTVTLKMESSTPKATRADSPTGLGTHADLTTGVIIFTNSGTITRYIYLNETSGANSYTVPDDATIPVVKPTILTGAGIEFTSLRATNVYIIGNRTPGELTGLPAQNSDGSVAGGSNINTFLADNVLDATTAADLGSGTMKDVVLFGSSTLTETTPLNYNANVTIKPVVARIELEKVTGLDLSFDLRAIYINNYHSAATLTGSIATTSTCVNHGTDLTKYVTTYPEALRDYKASGTLGTKGAITLAGGVSITPGEIWGYNFFASKIVDKLPHVILQLTNLKDSNGFEIIGGNGLVVEQFITVKSFKTAGDVAITEFKPGYVYTITDIQFSSTQTTEQPEMGEKDITAFVKVSIADWVDGGAIVPEL